MMIATKPLSWILSILLCASAVHSKRLRFASPLQSLTIPDHEAAMEDAVPPRQRFLARFRKGFEAEVTTRKALAAKRGASGTFDANWAEEASDAETRRRKVEDAIVERSFDRAVADLDDKPQKSSRSNNAYQFVGVVERHGGASPISWYARSKPRNANWSVRLIHVNRDAIVKDLFTQGKVDIFAKYVNTGEMDEQTNRPVVQTQYDVRERSWRNLWNFSPKHMLSDSSGQYWRERRLKPGLYTDGSSVYEASYRYRDGRNGMHRVSTLDQLLRSKAFDDKEKERVVQRLKEDAPDVVLEDL